MQTQNAGNINYAGCKETSTVTIKACPFHSICTIIAGDLDRRYQHVLCVDEKKSVIRCIYTVGDNRYLYTLSLESYGIVKSRRPFTESIQSVRMEGGDR